MKHYREATSKETYHTIIIRDKQQFLSNEVSAVDLYHSRNEPSIRNGTIALVMVPAAVFYFWVLFRHILIIRVTRIKNRQP